MMTPLGAQIPEGHFLGWTPGHISMPEPEELAWRTRAWHGSGLADAPASKRQNRDTPPGDRIVLHRSPACQNTIQAPADSRSIDIAAGDTNYVVADQCRLAADVGLLAILPHAHYLGREVEVIAALPDGTKQPLLRIRNWDFNWQSDYRYAQPMFPPKGTVISARFRCHNFEGNAVNPHHPPRRVTYGPESTDEMCELWLQVLPHRQEDSAAPAGDF